MDPMGYKETTQGTLLNSLGILWTFLCWKFLSNQIPGSWHFLVSTKIGRSTIEDVDIYLYMYIYICICIYIIWTTTYNSIIIMFIYIYIYLDGCGIVWGAFRIFLDHQSSWLALHPKSCEDSRGKSAQMLLLPGCPSGRLANFCWISGRVDGSLCKLAHQTSSDFIRLHQTSSDFIRLHQTSSDFIRLLAVLQDIHWPLRPKCHWSLALQKNRLRHRQGRHL